VPGPFSTSSRSLLAWRPGDSGAVAVELGVHDRRHLVDIEGLAQELRDPKLTDRSM